MFVDNDSAQVKCVCAVDERCAEFQIDCGSTFTQISSSLAPKLVPRLGLGFARSLGSIVWFPTCDVKLAPVDQRGNIVRYNGMEAVVSRVQVGVTNLLGLRELRQWRVQLSFSPEAHCSMSPDALSTSSSSSLDAVPGGTATLEEAIRAAEALSKGEVLAEDAVSDDYPWLVDIRKVLDRRRPESVPFWWPALSPVTETALTRKSPASSFRGSSAGASAAQILFGTPDALVSHTMPPPLLTWP